MHVKVIAGNSSPILSKRIAKELNIPLAKVTYGKFPDGELYVRVEDRVDKAIVVQSIRCSDDIVYLMLLFDVIKEAIAVIPYMGYARQDRAFNEGEAVSIRALAEFLESRAEKVISVNLHSREAASHFKNLIEVDAMPLIGEFYKKEKSKGTESLIMVSPDIGSLERVKVAAKIAGCEYDYLEKVRIDAENVEIKPKNVEVEGKKVVIVDDIISTGGTIAKAAETLKAKVEAACVHAVLASNALNKLFSAGVKKVISTDTIEQPVSKISVAKLLANAISNIYSTL